LQIVHNDKENQNILYFLSHAQVSIQQLNHKHHPYVIGSFSLLPSSLDSVDLPVPDFPLNKMILDTSAAPYNIGWSEKLLIGIFPITSLYSRNDPALDSSYLRLGRLLCAISSMIIHLTTKGR